MSHTVGVICQFGTAHQPDECTCGSEHGLLQVPCPTPEECQTFAMQCATCNPEALPVPMVRITTQPMSTLPPGTHAHAAETPENPVEPVEETPAPIVPLGYDADSEDLPTTGPEQ